MLPELRPEAADLLNRVNDFVTNECLPKEEVFESQIKDGDERWNSYPSVIDDLKEKAKSLGLWNLFLP